MEYVKGRGQLIADPCCNIILASQPTTLTKVFFLKVRLQLSCHHLATYHGFHIPKNQTRMFVLIAIGGAS